MCFVVLDWSRSYIRVQAVLEWETVEDLRWLSVIAAG